MGWGRGSPGQAPPRPQIASKIQEENTPACPQGLPGSVGKDRLHGRREGVLGGKTPEEPAEGPLCPLTLPSGSITHPRRAPRGLPAHRRDQGPAGAAERQDGETIQSVVPAGSGTVSLGPRSLRPALKKEGEFAEQTKAWVLVGGGSRDIFSRANGLCGGWRPEASGSHSAWSRNGVSRTQQSWATVVPTPRGHCSLPCSCLASLADSLPDLQSGCPA